MSRTYEYRSGLASQISAFIAEKRACGCKYEKEAKTFQTDIVNIGLHFFLKNVRPYAVACIEA